jgi:dihydrofolate reductase
MARLAASRVERATQAFYVRAWDLRVDRSASKCPWARAWDGHEVVDLAVGRLALHYQEENPDEVVAALDDKTKAVIRELEASTRRRAVRRAVDGMMPEGHLRSREKTRQNRKCPFNPIFDRRYAYVMRPLRYSINVTLDGCCDHRAMFADDDIHRHAVENLNWADALLFGRVTYEMMEAAFRPPAPAGARPDWMESFARTIDAAKKYVVSSTLDRVDWNAELVRGDLVKTVQQLKRESGKGLLVGGVKLPLGLAELGLIDEYEFVVQPRLVGHGPTLFVGLSKRIDLKLVSRLEFGSGAVAMRYEPT